MITQCKSCSRKYLVKDDDIPEEGRVVQCGFCSVTWHQMPASIASEVVEKRKVTKKPITTNKNTSLDSVKASDGKTYRFLGRQWAQLLPSGKTGLFARKLISQELNEITGRQSEMTTNQRKRKIVDLNPSSENLSGETQLPEIYHPKKKIGFISYIFLIIIVGFSLVGILETFKDDLLNIYPEIDYIFILLDKQLEFLAESIKNIIVIIKDLIGSY